MTSQKWCNQNFERLYLKNEMSYTGKTYVIRISSLCTTTYLSLILGRTSPLKGKFRIFQTCSYYAVFFADSHEVCLAWSHRTITENFPWGACSLQGWMSLWCAKLLPMLVMHYKRRLFFCALNENQWNNGGPTFWSNPAARLCRVRVQIVPVIMLCVQRPRRITV